MRQLIVIVVFIFPVIGFSQNSIEDLLAQAGQKQNNLPALIGIYGQVLKLDSCNYEAILGQGVTYYSRWKILGKIDKMYLDSAFIQRDKACKLCIADYRAFVARGNYFADFNDFRNAFSDFNKAIELNPDLVSVRWKRAQILIKWKDYENALPDLDFAIKNYGEPADWLYRYRALCYANLRMLSKCETDVKKALAINSKDNDNLLCLADYYAISGEYEKAIQKYSFIIGRNSLYALAYLKRGNVYHALEMNDKAEQDWNIARKKGIAVNDNTRKITFGRF